MKSARLRQLWLGLMVPVAIASFDPAQPASAQSVTPATDGTNTVVLQNGNRFQINGGTLSGDGTNLFQSFQQFGLNSGQVADFLTSPTIRNILGRVTGGNPSTINGLIKVTGGNSNLFLVNPAGIVFGAAARLNVPADFTATTANGLSFGDRWFKATGSNDYQTLIGNPSAFAFSLSQPGVIVNNGNLKLQPGQTLSLIAGSVTNNGRLAAPSGMINLAAVPGENLVRISQPGHLLSLEIQPLTTADGQQLAIRAQDLPAILTGNSGYILNQGQISNTGRNPGAISIAGLVVENRGAMTANGLNGGSIGITTKNFLDSGTINATGVFGNGGEIRVNYTGTAIQTASAQTGVNGTRLGGMIEFNGGNQTLLTTSGTFSATGQVGGAVHLFGQDLRLLATQIDARGKRGGGVILVGGDYQGSTQGATNAQTVLVNSASILQADALTAGNGGKVIIWSDQQTNFYGNITAKAGVRAGDGGLIEVSSQNQLVFGGMADASAANGKAGQLWLDPKNITIGDSTIDQSFQLLDPNPAAGNIFGNESAVLSNGNIVISAPGDDLIARDAGAVYLFDPNTGALLSTINGANVEDRFGFGALTALNNGNYVFGNIFADINGVVDAGTVILANGTTGREISRISGANPNDVFGSTKIVPLNNGNYVFGNPNATINGNVNAGTVILANGTTGQEINRISGVNQDDAFGNNTIVALINSNYVFGNPNADVNGILNSGAVILGNGATGTEISRISGANANEFFGSSKLTALDNGNYVFGNPFATINGVVSAGTVILANGTTGGEVSRISGLNPNDYFGSNAIASLGNGNFVFGNPNATVNGALNAGTVILANGTTGTEISRISGVNFNDSFGNADLIALSSGNYVFGNPFATINGVASAGTVILANGTTGGEVSRISGLNPNDSFGVLISKDKPAITALSNGNFVFGNPFADINGVVNAGTVILANGTTGGEISRISGLSLNDYFGSNPITALSNGNYVFGNSNASISGINAAGIVILAEGTTGAEISRISGLNSNDNLGNRKLTALSNGNYAFASPNANANGGRFDIGIANPSTLVGSYFSDRNITINPQLLTQLGNTGTSVTLQANNDLTVNNAIVFNNPNGNGGNLTLEAGRSLLLNSSITTDNGNLTLIANNTAADGVVNSQRDPGNAVINLAPNVTLNSGTGDITLTLNTSSGIPNSSGDITLAGNIDARNLTIENNGAGSINLPQTAKLNYTGEFRATTTGGNIQVDNPLNLTGNTFLNTGLGTGDIIFNNTINGMQNLSLAAGVGNVFFRDTVGGNIPIGNLIIDSANDLIATNAVFATSINHTNGTSIINLKDLTTTGGEVKLTTANSLTTGNINTAGGAIHLTSQEGAISSGDLISKSASGGEIVIKANTSIIAGIIDSQGVVGNGGNVRLDPSNDIQVKYINTEGGASGNGGNVDITTERFFRATDSFNRKGTLTSISSAAGNNSGNIIIRHGGNGIIPFEVGNSLINGTSGAITSGTSKLAPFQSLPFTTIEGNIALISVDKPPQKPDNLTIPVINPIDLNPSQTLEKDSIPTTIKPSSPLEIGTTISQLEAAFTTPFQNYLGVKETPIASLEQVQNTLQRIEKSTGTKPALIYANCVPQSGGGKQLELVLVGSQNKPVRQLVQGAICDQVFAEAQTLRRTVTNIRSNTSYLAPAQKLYQWLIKPIEQDLQAQKINNLVFIMDAGLRSIPIAALHDGKEFIIEKYSVGLMPSLSLTDTRYVSIKNASVLAMGASQFINQKSLPAVPMELSIISEKLGTSKSFLNSYFTLENLKAARTSQPYNIIHLATHAEFQPGKPENSFIQLWDTKLSLDKLRQLKLSDPAVELLVLSACRSALGDESVELGFTGLAIQAGVKSALGSLWYVSDEGTLGLMTSFYEQLKTAPIKAEALRQAQLAMLKGQVRLQGGRLITSHESIALPPELSKLGNKDLTHPFYWSAFTMIGNPW
jgi:filamentous hemagglutinin family protein